MNNRRRLANAAIEKIELKIDLAEFGRMEKRIAQGKTKLHKAKDIDEIFA